jgi:hypothetical protein
VSRPADEPTWVLPIVEPNYYPSGADIQPVASALAALYAAHNAPPETWDHDHVRACELAYRDERAKLSL